MPRTIAKPKIARKKVSKVIKQDTVEGLLELLTKASEQTEGYREEMIKLYAEAITTSELLAFSHDESKLNEEEEPIRENMVKDVIKFINAILKYRKQLKIAHSRHIHPDPIIPLAYPKKDYLFKYRVNGK